MADDEPPFRIACPVCRAAQPAQPVCRRCAADLALYLKALHSVRLATCQLAAAREDGDPDALAAAEARLRWLSPRHLAEESR